jgi:hypothetical protein
MAWWMDFRSVQPVARPIAALELDEVVDDARAAHRAAVASGMGSVVVPSIPSPGSVTWRHTCAHRFG